MSEKVDRLRKLLNYTYSCIAEMETKIHMLEYLSDMSVEKLLELFAAGWTLKPPEPPKYDEMAKLANTDKPKCHVCDMSDYILKDKEE